MEKFNETEIKYLAGLLDADGCLSFHFVDNKVYLEMSLAASESIDKHGYIDSLGEKAGSVSIRNYPGTSWSASHQWRVQARNELNMLLPRITKHMVIKGSHWKRMYDKWSELRGVSLDDVQVGELKAWSKESRDQPGPIKDKKHPTWAWTAGYIEGDGCLTFKKHSNPETKNGMTIKLMVVCHKNDRVGIDLLFKAFGGRIVADGDCLRWHRNLGNRDRSFALSFLRKVHRHAKLKKWKIEQILAYHNNQLQRLNED